MNNPHPLPETFAFSQSSLQAYEDCPRRFWLAYVEQLPWPAIEAAPVQEYEQLMRLGANLHLLIQRAEIGIDPEQLAFGLEQPLASWFDAYVRHRPADLPQNHVETERVLTIPLGAYRLAAKFDLITADPDGRVVIVDWKTARQRTEPHILRRRMQTLVYPYVLVEASAGMPWGPVQPEQVEMRYWFTAAPGQPVSFRYDRAQHDATHDQLQQVMAKILAGRREADFPKVMDTDANRKRFCSYCIYRSRCNRGVTAGDLTELVDAEEFFAVDLDAALEFTLADVDELAF
ncbi:MAG: PD-(D/E)XK nuclease family protein [Caldilineaceae bacterium]|nr:PD-(D/E)XK nuclease family protein [Caldilineaceae bacterium]